MRELPELLIADAKGKILNVPNIQAAGMKGNSLFRLNSTDLIKLPSGSELFMTPDRSPIGYDPKSKLFSRFDQNPFAKRKERCYAVSAFISPGYTVRFNSAFYQREDAKMLPLFSYAAVAFYKGDFYAAALRVDRELRQDISLMDIETVKKNVKARRKSHPKNRLFRHLERCALVYGCPAAKNLFLERYEAPLPTAPLCNAQCAGCISHQPKDACSITQPRIEFIPTPEEIAEVALYHMRATRDPVVSFGQGCEGEPLLVSDVIERAIRLIRKETSKGIININTNASRPQKVRRLFEAGLDSIRVSINSAREVFYARYYNPKGYSFKDVLRSIEIAKICKGFVSLNYLIMPGFSDSKDEFYAFSSLIRRHRIDMAQLRNLNIDPVFYFKVLKVIIDDSELIGIKKLVFSLKREFPQLMTGYFNPSKQRMSRRLRSYK
ncbi:radical SAM protein [Candidatus Omnitrophota bacterium]